MNREKISNLLSEMTEESYANAQNHDVFLRGVCNMQLSDVKAVFTSLANREIIAPLYKGQPATLNCLRKALIYVE